ncbi:hypothetical protein D3C79_794200 [compost metagenome]
MFKLLAEFEIIRLAGSRHVVLQMRKQADQVSSADRLGRSHRLQSRCELPARRGQQGLQRGKEGLACRIRPHFLALACRPSSCPHAPVFGTPARGRLQLGQHTGDGQQLVGFGIDDVDIAQDITLEKLEQDQFDP